MVRLLTLPSGTVTMPDALDRLHAALDLLHIAARDERETLGELSAHALRRDAQVDALRGGLEQLERVVSSLAVTVVSLQRTLDARTAGAA